MWGVVRFDLGALVGSMWRILRQFRERERRVALFADSPTAQLEMDGGGRELLCRLFFPNVSNATFVADLVLGTFQSDGYS